MSNNLFLDSLISTQKIFDYSFEEAVEQEILLADYDEPVFKIVKTNIEHTITQKYILDNKLIIDGYFKVSMYYQAKEKENLSVSTLKLPFQKQIDIEKTVGDDYFIYTQGEMQYVNTRAISQTRIDIRGVYRISAKVYCANDLEVITAINSKTVCGDDEKIEHFKLQGIGNRQFTIEDEADELEGLKQIINISTVNNNISTSVYKDKVNVKGEVTADIYYTKEEIEGVQNLRKTFLYNQIVDIKDIDENNISYTDFNLTAFSVTQNAENQKINANLTAVLESKSFKRQEVYALKDAFSKIYECSGEYKEIYYDKNLSSINKTIKLNLEETVENGLEVVHQFLNIGEIKTYFEEENLIAKAKVTAYVIVKNLQGEFFTVVKSEDCIIDSKVNTGKKDEYIASLTLSDFKVSINEEKLTLKINLILDGFMILKESVKLLSDFKENEEELLEKNSESLILYYAKKGESIFDIARRYRIAIPSILKENEIETKVLQEDKMLIISAFMN